MVATRWMNIDWIATVVVYQLYAISVLAVFTAILLRWRTFRRSRLEKYKSEYGVSIASAVASGATVLSISKPSSLSFFRRTALRETLLENISSITGDERAMLVVCYVDLGCAQDDQWDCTSILWWRRLQGLSNLSILQRQEAAPLFEQMRKDENSLVAAAALLGLSQMKDERNNPGVILAELPRAFVNNGNLLLELANNWTTLFGQQWVAEYIYARPQSRIAKALITVLITLQTPEAIQLLLDIYENDLQKDERLRNRIRRAILDAGDVKSLARLESLSQITHFIESIEEAA